MRLSAALLLTALSCNAQADVILHLGSYHMAQRAELAARGSLNEANLGVGYREGDLEIGVYNNSMSVWSMYVKKDVIRSGQFALFFGAVTGYDAFAPVVPAVGMSYNVGHAVFNVFPGVTTSGEVVPVLTYSIAIK